MVKKTTEAQGIRREILSVARRLKEARGYAAVIATREGTPYQIDVVLSNGWAATDGIIIRMRKPSDAVEIEVSLDAVEELRGYLKEALKAARTRNTLLKKVRGQMALRDAVRILSPAFTEEGEAAAPHAKKGQ